MWKNYLKFNGLTGFNEMSSHMHELASSEKKIVRKIYFFDNN